jgi:hypothetical protein
MIAIEIEKRLAAIRFVMQRLCSFLLLFHGFKNMLKARPKQHVPFIHPLAMSVAPLDIPDNIQGNILNSEGISHCQSVIGSLMRPCRLYQQDQSFECRLNRHITQFGQKTDGSVSHKLLFPYFQGIPADGHGLGNISLRLSFLPN